MPTAVEQLLGNLHRTLSAMEDPQTGVSYRVTAVTEPFIDKEIGGCLVTERVGQGAMSVIYKGLKRGTTHAVAIKMLRAQLATDPHNVKRFQREGKAISRLNHPNLLKVHEVGEVFTGQPFIIMDFVQGRSLGEIIASEGALPWQRALTVFVQVCDAMNHAHQLNIIHRDLKPDNIMLVNVTSANDFVKVVDFGIVKMTDESQALSQKLTQTGEVWGSPVYMSPEQCAGKTLDARTDIYSFGTVMYECLTGRQLFGGKRMTDIIMKQLNHRPESFAVVCPEKNIPTWFEEIVMETLEKEPYKRFQSMFELKQAMEEGWSRHSRENDPANSQLANRSGARRSTEEILTSSNTPVHAKPTAAMDLSAAAACVAASSAPVNSGPGIIVPSANHDEFVNRMIAGKFLVESFVGDGGMSTVYRAIQQGVDRPVAVKILREELCGEESYVKRFQREAKQLSKLTHPNLIQIFDVGVSHTGQPYMVMEFLEGKSLHDWLLDNGNMPLERAFPIMLQICDVMDYAHKQGIIHRDLKPHNVMLSKHAGHVDFVKVVDFGILKLDPSLQSISQKLTQTGEICGSPIYMSPEQILDEPLDRRSDVYSLGILMFELVTGRPPFAGKKITQVMNQHVNVKPPSLQETRPDLNLPPTLDVAIRRALEKKPSDRYQTMDDYKNTLATIYHRLGLAGKASTTSGGALSPAYLSMPTETLAGPVTSEHQKPVRKGGSSAKNQQIQPATSTPQQSAAKVAAIHPIMVGAIVVIAVLIGAAVAFFALKSQQGTSTPPSADPKVHQSETKQPSPPHSDSQTSEQHSAPNVGIKPAAAVPTSSSVTSSTPQHQGRPHHRATRARETLSDVINTIEQSNVRRPHLSEKDDRIDLP